MVKRGSPHQCGAACSPYQDLMTTVMDKETEAVELTGSYWNLVPRGNDGSALKQRKPANCSAPELLLWSMVAEGGVWRA